MNEDRAALIEALRDAEAAYRLERWRGPTPVIQAAVELVAAGQPGSALVTLAGDDHAEADDLTHDLDAAVRELGLVPLDARRAANRIVALLLRPYVAGQVGAAVLAPRIWDVLEAARGAYDDSADADIMYVAYIAESLLSEPEYITEADFDQAVKEFLDDVASGEVATT